MTLLPTDDHDALIGFYRQNDLEVSDSIVKDDCPVYSLLAFDGGTLDGGTLDGGTLAGAATLSQRHRQFVLDYVAVLPAYRRQSLGAQLTNALLEKAKALGAERVHIVTRNKPFFMSLGFFDGASGALELTKDCKDCGQYNVSCFPVEMIFEFLEV